MTATKVLPEREAEEVQQRYAAFCAELTPSGEVGCAYVLRAATLSARMERCVEYETAMLTERVRRAEADFEPPEGVDDAEAERLRKEAGKRALFDSSKEAVLARKYEAAAERGFHRALKELRQHERALKAEMDEILDDKSGSILSGGMTDAEFEALCSKFESPTPRKGVAPAVLEEYAKLKGRIDLPFSVGKPR